jgi:hypothetical protein
MNERLREFEKESKLEIFGLGARRVPWEAALEKYAELIVQECILVIEENAENIHAEGTIEAIVNLEKHFGVE